MTGFLYKDLLLMRRQITYIVTLILIYTALSAVGVMPASILGGVVVIMGIVFPMNAFSGDDQAHWDKFAAAVPEGRRKAVAGRYLFVLLLILGTSVLVTALLLLLRVTGLLEEPLAELLLPVPACAAIALIMDGVLLPVVYKFGMEKYRILSIIIFLVIFFGCMGLGKLASLGSGSGLLSLPDNIDALVFPLLLILAVAAVVIFVVSYRISLGIYRRKEF